MDEFVPTNAALSELMSMPPISIILAWAFATNEVGFGCLPTQVFKVSFVSGRL